MSALSRAVAVGGAVFLVVASSSAEETSVPATVSMTVYRFGLSTSPTCENLTIYTLEAPTLLDFASNPTLGSADVPAGTYPCVALEVGNTMTAAALRPIGNCTTQPQTIDFCQAMANIAERNLPPPPPGSKHGPTPGSTDAGGPSPSQGDAGTLPPAPTQYEAIDGNQPLGGGPSEVWRTCPSADARFVIYLTTQVPLDSWTNTFRPPTSATDVNHGYHLASPLVVGGARTTGTFVASIPATSDESGCNIGGPTFAFETANE